MTSVSQALTVMTRLSDADRANVTTLEQRTPTRLVMSQLGSAFAMITLTDGSAQNAARDISGNRFAIGVRAIRQESPRRNAIRIQEDVCAR